MDEVDILRIEIKIFQGIKFQYIGMLRSTHS